tara:strand:- start:651 stop:1655 length:1005 start_codon:yes stop_codon:yes gene_type:complete
LKFLTLLIKFGIVGLASYLAIKSDFFATWNMSFNVSLLYSGLTVQPIILCALLFLAIRHVLLIGSPRIKLRVAFRAMILAQGLNLILPARLSELLKATYLRDHANVPLSTGISAIVLERTVDIIILSALGFVALVNYFDRGDFATTSSLGFILIILMVTFIRSPSPVFRVIHMLPSARLIDFLERTYFHFSTTAKTRIFWQALLLGGLTWGLSYANILVFLQLAGSIPVGLSGALLVFVMTTLGGAIPALPGGLGTYEAAAVIALRSLGYSFEEAVALSLVMHASQLVLPFILAMLIMLTERLGISSLIADLRASTRPTDNTLATEVKTRHKRD